MCWSKIKKFNSDISITTDKRFIELENGDKFSIDIVYLTKIMGRSNIKTILLNTLGSELLYLHAKISQDNKRIIIIKRDKSKLIIDGEKINGWF